MKSVLKAPGIKLLKVKYDEPLSNFAFNFNLRHYTLDFYNIAATPEDLAILKVKEIKNGRLVGRCSLTISKPVLK